MKNINIDKYKIKAIKVDITLKQNNRQIHFITDVQLNVWTLC